MKKIILICVLLFCILMTSCQLPGTSKKPSFEDVELGETITVPFEEHFRESLK